MMYTSLCAIKSIRYVVYYITYYFYAYFYTKGRQSSEEAVFTVNVWVCIFTAAAVQKSDVYLFCAQFFEALIFAIHIDIRNYGI